MLRRSRHRELDKLRSIDIGFCKSWFLFFETCPPGLHPAGVFFTEGEKANLAAGVSPLADSSGPVDVEPFDGDFRSDRGVG